MPKKPKEMSLEEIRALYHCELCKVEFLSKEDGSMKMPYLSIHKDHLGNRGIEVKHKPRYYICVPCYNEKLALTEDDKIEV